MAVRFNHFLLIRITASLISTICSIEVLSLVPNDVNIMLEIITSLAFRRGSRQMSSDSGSISPHYLSFFGAPLLTGLKLVNRQLTRTCSAYSVFPTSVSQMIRTLLLRKNHHYPKQEQVRYLIQLRPLIPYSRLLKR